MKILLLSFGIPTKKNPQAGCFAMDQAIALHANGHNVGILSLNGKIGKEWKKPGVKHWVQDGIECFEAFGIPIAIVGRLLGPKATVKLTQRWAISLFPKVIKKFGYPDIVHAHFLTTMIQGAAIKKAYRITLVGTEHWSKLAEPELQKDVKYYGNYSYPAVDKLICVSKNLRECVRKNFGKDSVVIHNLFNTSLLQPALPKTNNKLYTIAAVGSLIERKGFDLLIQAIAASDLSDKNIRVNIYGTGPQYGYLHKMIQKNALEDKIILCGQKSKAELYQELRRSDLFVLSSRLENFSVAIIEATGNGLPAVATLCGGIEEYPIRNVIKIPTNDVNALKVAIETAYKERNMIDRIAIQQQTIYYYSPKSIIKQIEDVYRSVLIEKEADS
ncbi:glycosyltransferase family 4 protein [bacterium]|nr:glycosyltransferase family 4 protein [bacterium]